MEIPILYEDSDIVGINKPVGVLVHPDGKSSEETISDWLQKQYSDIKGVGEPLTLSGGEIIERPGIVHRLDRDTSGVLIAAKNQKAFLNLKGQFASRRIHKVYNAFVYGELKEEKGIIDKAIGRHSKDFRLRTAERGARGTMREAVTEYTVLARNKEASYVEVRPQTARPHQIRVHFKAIQHLLVCDPLYAPKKKCILGFKRVALHASKISLSLPSGEDVHIKAPPPPDFECAYSVLTGAISDCACSKAVVQ